jgi:crotonobetainyl-CoA:carnitine CoA-transferase CaiB-like acyl-CoA transferase
MNKLGNATKAQGPLAGIKVLDFCSFINGAYSATLLGDLGAEVLKIEPLTGDLARAWGPFLKGESRFYQAWNRNKRGLAVDLRSKAGREIAHRLVRDADVVIENYRPGVTEKLGIDYPTLKELNPRLIYCSSTAFGAKGPLRNRPGYDPVFQSISGIARDNVRFSGKVAICPVAVSDYQASMLVVTGVLAALFHRERTGESQMVETSLLQGVLSVQSHYFVEALECEEEGAIGIYPYRIFETADEPIFIAAATDKFWCMLCESLGVHELGPDPQFATNGKRTGRAADLNAILGPLFLTRKGDEWESILVEKGVPCGVVSSYLKFLNDPQVGELGMNPVIDHPLIGPMRTAGVPIHFEKTPGRIQCAAPTLGQHTDEVLAEIGYSSERIAALKAEGVINAAGLRGAGWGRLVGP